VDGAGFGRSSASGHFISGDSSAAATRLCHGIRRRTDPLRLYPFLGRVVPEYGDQLRRELIHPPYRIIYQVFPEQQKVEIPAVVHSARLLVQ
jgi:plasmid stabilization system protein ParE